MVSLLPLSSPSNLFLSPFILRHVLTVSGKRSTNDNKMVQYLVSFLSKYFIGLKKANCEVKQSVLCNRISYLLAGGQFLRQKLNNYTFWMLWRRLVHGVKRIPDFLRLIWTLRLYKKLLKTTCYCTGNILAQLFIILVIFFSFRR